MKSRIILYVSALLIYWVFRGYRPAPQFDSLELVSDEVFKLNDRSYPAVELESVIREYRRGLPPHQELRQKLRFEIDHDVTMGLVYDAKAALRKNGLLRLHMPSKPIWQFW